MSHLFISYRTLETDFALTLANDLSAAGYPIWMDRLKGILPGDDWVQTLQDALNGMSVIIPILSLAFVRSDHCRRELKRAKNLQKPILPVLLTTLPHVDFPFEIENLQYIDFTGWQDRALYQTQLQKLIVEGLQDSAKVHPSAAPTTAAPSGQPLPGRVMDDEIESAQKTVDTLSGRSRMTVIKLKSLKKDLDLYYAQYSAIVERRLITPDPAHEVQLRAEEVYFEAKIAKVESEISQLARESA